MQRIMRDSHPDLVPDFALEPFGDKVKAAPQRRAHADTLIRRSCQGFSGTGVFANSPTLVRK